MTAQLILFLAMAQAPDLPARLDEQVRAYVDQQKFNGSVLVARDGKELLKRGYGLANAEWNIANTPTTKFRLGSITKQFTAMLILQLEQQGKLSVNDPACKYVEDCPAAWQPITIHHLLTHTSGIPNFTSFPDYLATMHEASPPKDTLKRVRDKPLVFDPGTKWQYSNSGYVLLGYIIEKVAGMPYADLLKKNIFGPLEMNDTGYERWTDVLPNRAAGYERGPGGLRNAAYINMTIPHAAGALYSTVEDLCKWDQALYTQKLLPKEAMTRYFTPFKDDYAYGWAVQKFDGMDVIQHGGGINGFSTQITRVPALKLVVIALDNVLPAATGKMADDLMKLAAGHPVDKPGTKKEISVKPEILRQYIGAYVFSPAFKIDVTLEDGALITQATGQPKLPIYAESETRFFPKLVDATLIFEKDGEGKVMGLTLEQNGRTMRATRQ